MNAVLGRVVDELAKNFEAADDNGACWLLEHDMIRCGPAIAVDDEDLLPATTDNSALLIADPDLETFVLSGAAAA